MSKKQRRLKDIRIEMPKGVYYEVLEASAKLHGAPSMSKYILNAALTYTKTFLEEKQREIDARKKAESEAKEGE